MILINVATCMRRFLLLVLFFVSTQAFSQSTWVNLKKFGARGTGVVDDTKALEDAIQYCKGKNIGIILSGGKYLINKQIVVTQSLFMKGLDGAEIILGNGVKNNLFYFIELASGTKIEKIRFVSKNNTSSNETMRFDGIKNIILENCFFDGALPVYFNKTSKTTLSGNVFVNTKTSSNPVCGFVNAKDIEISNNSFTFGGGLQFSQFCSRIKIVGNQFRKNSGYPLHFDGSFPNRIKWVIIESNRFTGTGERAYHGGTYDQISCFKIERLLITKNIVDFSGDMGITLAHCRDVVVERNTVSRSNTSAMSITNVFNCFVENNSFTDNGTLPNEFPLDPKARAGLYFYVESLQNGTDSLFLKNNKTNFRKGASRYYPIGVNGANPNFIKIYFAGGSTFQDKENYLRRNIALATYDKLKAQTLAKLRF